MVSCSSAAGSRARDGFFALFFTFDGMTQLRLEHGHLETGPLEAMKWWSTQVQGFATVADFAANGPMTLGSTHTDVQVAASAASRLAEACQLSTALHTEYVDSGRPH